MYKFGTVVLIPFPFTDLTSNKVRPALIVSKTLSKATDVTVAFITSNLDFDNPGTFLLRRSEDGFEKSGLKVDSTFRFDKLATLHKKLILGELGGLPDSLLKKMKGSFLEAFGF